MIMPDVRVMTAADIPFGMRLKDRAGWNQTPADWRRYLELQPDGCFVACANGAPVGTTTTCIFGRVAWVAMVLVDEAYRGQGIGRALMDHALAFLDRQGVRSVRLDATALGRPLYEKLGFETEYTLHRYEGVLPPGEAAKEVEPLDPGDLDDVLALDRSITHTDRQKLLRRLAAEFPAHGRVLRRSGRVAGFCLCRPGARAFQLGPCIAQADVGRRLLHDAGGRLGGERVYVDIPDTHREAVSWATASGLGAQRSLIRMCRGPKLGESAAELWASSGPEMG